MGVLAPSTEEFLRVVSWVSELEAMDVALIRAGRELSARLARAEDEADSGAYEAALLRLGKVGMLRGEIARELRLARVEGQLQVLGTAEAAPGRDEDA